jgi:hypothetical protein
MAYRGNKTGKFEEIQNITSTYDPKIFKTKEERKLARQDRWSEKKRRRKGLDAKPGEESTIQESDSIKVDIMKRLQESSMKKGPGMRYDVGPITSPPPTEGPTGSVTINPNNADKKLDVKSKGKKFKTQKSPYKSKHLKTSFISKLFGGSGSFRTKVRRTKDISGKRIGKR